MKPAVPVMKTRRVMMIAPQDWSSSDDLGRSGCFRIGDLRFVLDWHYAFAVSWCKRRVSMVSSDHLSLFQGDPGPSGVDFGGRQVAAAFMVCLVIFAERHLVMRDMRTHSRSGPW
jgi:hypothetical protein